MIEINVIVDDRMQSVQDAMERAGITNLRYFAGRVVNRARRSILWNMDPGSGFGEASQYSAFQRAALSGFGLSPVRFAKKVHAKPGEPPRSALQPGRNLRDAITSNTPTVIHRIVGNYRPTFVADDGSAQIGTDKSEIGDIGSVMEFGGEYKGDHFAPHPFLRPAFDQELSSIAGDWSGSIGE